jgi:multidrug resistance efflux pump
MRNHFYLNTERYLMKKFALIVTWIAAASLLLSACAQKTTDTTAAAQQPSLVGIIAEGRLQPVNTLDHSFSISGQVAEVLVADGETVSAGRPLARLVDSPEAAAALTRSQQEVLSAQQALDALTSSAEVNIAQAKLEVLNADQQVEDAQIQVDQDNSEGNRALLDSARASLNMAKDTLAKLQANSGVDPDQLASARALLESANAAVLSAQALIDAHILKAALDGTVIDLNLQAGQQVSAGNSVLVVADTSNWVVKTDNLTEIDLPGVKEGQAVEVVLDALPDATLTGEVSHINTRYEEKRGDITYTVTVLLTQTDPQMRWGMTAAVHFLP